MKPDYIRRIVEGVESGFALILQNARDLIEESEILFAAERWPRAYALAHLASEELAKLPMIFGYASRVRLCGLDDWGSFYKRFCNHQAKWRGIESLSYLLDSATEANADVKRFMKALKAIPARDSLKNRSLYVAAKSKCDFESPRGVISSEVAKNAIDQATASLQFHSKVPSGEAGWLKKLLDGVEAKLTLAYPDPAKRAEATRKLIMRMG